ncbi:MAG TPA: four helix bundle protein [Thermoanaerobaculia bacterium]|jgi:four helix bundle protein|nr:four helix bundle protein [Thermoanaerobaculia bacterium]
MSDSYRDLVAWKKAMELATALHRASGRFPKSETYALTVQLRKSAYSVPSNIAEGKGRDSKTEFVMFLYRARGSLYEAQTQVEIARNLEYISQEEFATLNERCAEVGKVLNGLIRSVERQLGPA